MKLNHVTLARITAEVKQERLSLGTGSPSDAEIAREKLADLALSYLPDLVHELIELRSNVTSLLEDFAAGCVPVKMERGKDTTPYWRGVNTERAKGLAWAELKCKELGIEWPIQPIPYGGISAPAPPESLGSGEAGQGGGVGRG